MNCIPCNYVCTQAVCVRGPYAGPVQVFLRGPYEIGLVRGPYTGPYGLLGPYTGRVRVVYEARTSYSAPFQPIDAHMSGAACMTCEHHLNTV